MKLVKIPQTKTSRTIDFLFKNGETELAWRLTHIELKRLLLQLRQARLDRAKSKNRARWNDLAIDIDHFILLKNEKG